MPKGGVANRAIKALNVLPGQHKLGKGKRFKFLTFQDLINRVDVSRDVYRDTTTKLQLAPADGAESFFQQYLAEWSELDLTADFKTFANEVYPLSQSLAQLLHYRKRVVRSLLGQLRQPRCTCSLALLDLVAHLARDLRDEFWPFFPDAVRAITLVLDAPPADEGPTADAELFAAAFRALAFLFKYLLRQLLGEPSAVLPLYRPLLGHEREHVRNFAAESLAFLVRKIAQRQSQPEDDEGGQLNSTMRAMFAFCTPPEPEQAEGAEATQGDEPWEALQGGVAATLFESVKGVGNRLHSNAEQMLALLFEHIQPPPPEAQDPASAAALQCRRAVVKDVLHRLCQHVRAETAERVWDALHAEVEAAASSWHEIGGEPEEQRLELSVQALAEWSRARLARTRLRRDDKQDAEEDGKEEEEAGQRPQKKKRKLLKPATVAPSPSEHYRPAEEIERVWASLRSVLCPPTAGRPLPPALGAAATEAIMSLLHAVRRFQSEEQTEVLQQCVRELSAAPMLQALLGAGEAGGGEPMLPCSVAYPFVQLLVDWEHFGSVSAAVFGAVLAHVGTASQGGGYEAAALLISIEAQCPEEHRGENGRVVVAQSVVDLAVAALKAWGGTAKPKGKAKSKAKRKKAAGAAESEAARSSRAWLGLGLLRTIQPAEGAGQALISAVEKLHKRVLKAATATPKPETEETDAVETTTEPLRALRSACLQTQASLLRDFRPEALPPLLERLAASFAEEEGLRACPLTLASAVDCFQSAAALQSGDARPQAAQLLQGCFAALAPSLASPLSAVRLATARLLRAAAELSGGQSGADWETLNKMVTIAESPLEFGHGRELNLDVQRIGHTLGLNRLSAQCRQVVPYFLLGVLKTKFTMLWTSATDVLVEETTAEWEHVWPLLQAEVEQMQARTGSAGFMLRRKFDERAAAALPEPVDAEAIESDPGDPWASQCQEELEAKFLEWRVADPACTDYPAYHTALWAVMEKASVVVERKNRVLVGMYLEFLEQYRRMWDEGDEEEGDGADEEAAKSEDEDEDEDAGDTESGSGRSSSSNMTGVSKKLMNSALCDYLRLFATFKNAKGLRSAEQVRASYEGLLVKAEPEIQTLALECLLTFKDANLGPYKESLMGIIDEKTFRSTLAMFKLAEDESIQRRAGENEVKVTVVHADHRPQLIPVLVRILYGKLLHRKGRRHASQSLSNRRGTVLAYLAGLRPEELVHLFDIIFEPYKEYLHATTGESQPEEHAQLCARSQQMLVNVSLTRRTGVLKMLLDVVRQLATLILPSLPSILRVQIGICQAALFDLAQPASDEPKAISGRHRIVELRNLALKQIASIFDLFPSFDYSAFMTEFMATVSPMIRTLPLEGMQAQHPTPMLTAIKAVTAHSGLLDVALSSPRGAEDTRAEMTLVMQSLVDCLDTPNIAVPVLDAVLTCLHNLLVHDERSETSHTGPFISLLLEKLRDRIARVVGSSTHGKDVRKNQRSAVDTTLLNLISQLTKMTTDTAQLTDIGRMFLPFIKSKGLLTHEELVSVLGVLRDLVPHFEDPSFFAVNLARVLYTLQSKTTRTALLAVYTQLGEAEESLAECTQMLSDINAYDEGRLGEYNFEVRQAGYARFIDDAFDIGSLSPAQVLPLLYNCFHDMEDDDLSVRTNGASAITETVRAFKDQDADETWPKGGLVPSYVIPMLKGGLKKTDEVVRDQFVRLLGTTVRLVPTLHPDMLCLTNDDDPEIDVLNNMVHIQLHRRIRSLSKLKSTIESGDITPSSMTGFVIPMVTHYVYAKSVTITKGGTRGGKDVVKQGGHNMVAGAIDVIGTMCKRLPWGKYNRVLMHFLRQIADKPEAEKALLRLICCIIDNFHFGKSQNVATITTSEAAGPKDEEAEEEAEDDEAKAEPEAEDASEMTAEQRAAVDRAVAERILPSVYRHLSAVDSGGGHSQMDTEVDGKGVRQPIALAIVKLLQVLPQTMLQQRLPRLINVLANSLKSHMQSIRDESRKTLVQVIAALGPHYLYFAVEEMKGVLLRGYQRHVLAYTVHALLSELAPVVANGALDHCYDSILPVLQDELVGALSHEKEVDALMKKTREYKVGKAYDSFKLLAQSVSFGNLPALLAPVRSVLAATSASRTLQKVEEVLKRIAQGLLLNESATHVEVFQFCHRTIMQQHELGKKKNELAVAKKRTYAEASGVVDEAHRDVSEDAMLERQNAHHITEFALGLLHVQVKRDGDGFKLRDPETLALVEPFVEQLLACLKSRENKVLELALKVVGLLVPLGMAAMEAHAKALARRCFKALSSAGDAVQLSQACYRCIAIILRDLPAAEVSDHQLKVLLKFVETELDSAGQQGEQHTSFVLLKAIVSRRLITTEVYDSMDACFKLLIRSQSPSTRTHCSGLLLQFLLEYPLGPKRLQRHLDFIVKNLDYSLESGREAAMGMLNAIVVKFPAQVLLDQVDFIFMAVVVRLVSDESQRCRSGAAALLQSVLSRALAERQSLYEQLVGYALQWYRGDKPELQRAAAQLVGLAVEVEGVAVEKRLPSWLPVMVEALESGAAEAAEEEQQGDAWRIVYYTLRSLEKLGQLLPGMLDGAVSGEGLRERVTPLWEAITSLLRHPHTWVKLLAARLVGALFARCNPPAVSRMASGAVELKLGGCGAVIALRQVEEGLWTQLRSTHLDEKMAEQALKDLVFVARAYHAVALEAGQQSGGDAEHATMEEEEDQPEEQDDEDDALAGAEGSSAPSDRSEFGRLFSRFARLSRATHKIRRSNKPETTREGDWICTCENHNFASRSECGRCGKAKGQIRGITTAEAAQAAAVAVDEAATAANAKVVEDLRRLCCLRWMAAASRLAADGAQGLAAQPHRAQQILACVYHLLPQGGGSGAAAAAADAAGLAEDGVPPELATLAQDIADEVKELLGPVAFTQAYGAVSARVRELRQARKRQRATEKVLDPQRAAKRQSRKNERKKASRKRKVQRFKGKNGRSAANGARTHALQVHQEARGSTF